MILRYCPHQVVGPSGAPAKGLDVNDLWTKITYFLSITLTILREKWAWVRLTSRPPGLFDCVLPRTNFIFMLTLHLGGFYKIVRASNWRLFLLKMMTSMAIQLDKIWFILPLRISLFGIFLVLKISKKKVRYSLGLILILHGDTHWQTRSYSSFLMFLPPSKLFKLSHYLIFILKIDFVSDI